MGHYLKSNKSTRTPSTFICWDTETKPHEVDGRTDRVIHRLHLGYASCFRLEGGRMTRRKSYTIHDPFYFWDWIIQQLSPHRPVWMFAHNVGFDLTTCRIWELIEQGDFSLDRYVSDDPPVILGLQHERGKLVVLDSMNWFRSKLSDMAADEGMAKIDVDFDTCTDADLMAHCKRDVEILEQRIFSLLIWLKGNDLGVMQKTAPGQALQCYRHRFGPSTVVDRERVQRDGTTKVVPVRVCYPIMHDNPDLASGERRAYFGGEARCFWTGRIYNPDSLGAIGIGRKGALPARSLIGPIYHLDVNSLYPYVMRQNHYPCKYVATHRDMSLPDLANALAEGECIATVKLVSHEQAFPIRVGTLPNYCIGTFWTALCGDELRYALSRGFIQKVDECYFYERMLLFRDYVDFFWGMRQDYKAAGNKSGEKLCKLMLNSLYGKFGARAYKWESRENVLAKKPWGQWPDDTEEDGEVRLYRAIGWNTQEKMPEGEGRDSFVPIPACVTANARTHMRSLRWIAGDHAVIYQHTDSLHVTKEGYDRLNAAGWVSENELGKLKLVETVKEGEYRGLNNQTINGADRIAGVKGDAERLDDGGYSQSQFASLARVVASKPPTGILVRTATVHPAVYGIGGNVDANGWVTPLKLGV